MAGTEKASSEAQIFKPDPVLFAAAVKAYEAGKYEEAFALWMPMAQQGDLAAMRNIGHMLRRGLGTEADPERALYFYRRAASRGLAGAQANLGMMLLEEPGDDEAAREAAKWFYRAAQGGHVRSMYQLGLLLEQGRGVKQSDEAAAKLYLLAARAGFDPAARRLAAIQGRLGLPLSVAAGLSPSEAEASSPAHGWVLPGGEMDDDAIEAAAAGGLVIHPRPRPAPDSALPALSLRGPLSIDYRVLNMPPNWPGSRPDLRPQGLDCFSKPGPIGPVWMPCKRPGGEG